MKTWMYAPGSLSDGELAALKEAGVTGVMGPKEIAAPALAQGLQVLLCGGAFPAAGFAGEDHLALDIRGRRRVWFYSCCPNHGPTRQANLAMYRELAATPGIGGLVIDGARFASPASSFQPEAFFTCFCPRALTRSGCRRGSPPCTPGCGRAAPSLGTGPGWGTGSPSAGGARRST